MNPVPVVSQIKPKKSINLKLITLIFLLLALLGGIGVTYYFLNKPVTVPPKAFYTPTEVIVQCLLNGQKTKKIHMKAISESPQCPQTCTNIPSSVFDGVNQYKTTYRIWAEFNNPDDAKDVSVTYRTSSYYCTEACGNTNNGTNDICTNSPNPAQPNSVTGTIPKGGALTVDITRNFQTVNGKACGSAQTDFYLLSVEDCPQISPDQAGSHTSWGLCYTGQSCQAQIESTPTPSPTEIPGQPTATPIPQNTPTPTPSTTPSPTPSAAPNPTASPTPTPNPRCGDSCSSNAQCPNDHICSGGKCVLAQCLVSGVTCDSTKCTVIAPTNTPTPTEIVLAQNTGTPGPSATAKPTQQMLQAGGTKNSWVLLFLPALIVLASIFL